VRGSKTSGAASSGTGSTRRRRRVSEALLSVMRGA
jgi:hypothetical protein